MYMTLNPKIKKYILQSDERNFFKFLRQKI